MKGLTIGIDATFAGSRGAERHGIYRYLTQLLLHFQDERAPHRFRLWFNAFRRGAREGVTDFLREVDAPSMSVVVSRFPNRLRDALKVPAEWFTGPLDLFHSPSHVLPCLRKARGVVTIHDLAFLRMTENLDRLNADWCTAIRRRSPRPADDLATYRTRCEFFLDLRRRVPETLKRADAVVTDSEATARDLEDLAGVSRSRQRIVPCGVTPGMAVIREDTRTRAAKECVGARDRYVLYVGVFDPNKDLHTLLRAFAETSPGFRREHDLVLAGPRNWFQSVLEEEAERLGLLARVRFPGFVPDTLLPALYSGATCAVCPSPLEGFGLPTLEAMACGTPVIVADAGALPEVAGEAALKVPPSDPSALALAMERCASDAVLAGDLVARGLKRCREFSWQRTARMTLAVYQEVAG